MSFFLSGTTSKTTNPTSIETDQMEKNKLTSVYFPDKGEIPGADPLWILSIDGTPLVHTKTYEECRKIMGEYADYLVFNSCQNTRARIEYSYNTLHIVGSNKFSFISYDKTLYYLSISQVLNCPSFN